MASVKASQSWAIASLQSIRDDIASWQRQYEALNGELPQAGSMSDVALSLIIDAAASEGALEVSLPAGMRDHYYRTGTLPGFMGATWTVNDQATNSISLGADDAVLCEDVMVSV